MSHTYKPTLRPVNFATLPQGVEWDYVEAPAGQVMTAQRRGIPLSQHPFGIITLNRALTKEECERYGMEEQYPRVYTEVYCTAGHEEEVNAVLHELYQRMQQEHPEWKFDWSPSWDEAED